MHTLLAERVDETADVHRLIREIEPMGLTKKRNAIP